MEETGIGEQSKKNAERMTFIDPTTFPEYSENDKRLLSEVEAKIYPKERKGMIYEVPTEGELEEYSIPQPEFFIRYFKQCQEYLKGRAMRDKFGSDESNRDRWKEPIMLGESEEEKRSLEVAYNKDNQFRGTYMTGISISLKMLLKKYSRLDKESDQYLQLDEQIGKILPSLDNLEAEVVASEDSGIPYDNELYYHKRLKIVRDTEDIIMKVSKVVLPSELLKGEEIDIT